MKKDTKDIKEKEGGWPSKKPGPRKVQAQAEIER